MRRAGGPGGGGRRLPSTKAFAVGNLMAIAALYGYVQWRIGSSNSTPVRLLGGVVDTSEQDLMSKASSLEAMSLNTLEGDRRLRALAPPRDWESIAAEGALRLQQKWEADPEKQWFNRPGMHLSYSEPDPVYPFQRIKYTDGSDTGIIMIAAPFYDTNYYRAEAARATFWRLKAKGHIMVGITSYQEFPGKIMNPHDDRHTTPQDSVIHAAIDAWLHCFREPDLVLPPGVPRLLLSESDFHDPDRNDSGGILIPDEKIPKQYDLVYSNQGGDWNDFARNWTVAKPAIINLIKELDFKVLILGRSLATEADADLAGYLKSGQIAHHPPGAPWRDFLLQMQTARTLFVPNVHDASPRVVAEAMCFNMTVVMNEHIVGGWKYINRQTGEFFTNSTDVVEAFRRLRDPERKKELAPRDWYKSTWGKWTAAYRLQAFMEAAAGEDRIKAIQRDLKAFHANNAR